MRKIKTYGKKTYRLLTIAGGLLIAGFLWNMRAEERGVLTLLSVGIVRADSTVCPVGFTHFTLWEDGSCFGDAGDVACACCCDGSAGSSGCCCA